MTLLRNTVIFFAIVLFALVIYIFTVAGPESRKQQEEYSSKMKYLITHTNGRIPSRFLANSYKLIEGGRCLETDVKNVCGNFTYRDNPGYAKIPE